VQVGVFDTAFHQTMPPSAYLYALPYKLYEQHGVRRFGMHGTSYRFLLGKAAEHLKKPEEELNLIIAHLGKFLSLAFPLSVPLKVSQHA
jgi:acetate kinase